MPVVLGGLLVRGPHVGPEPHRLGGGRTALDHDAERSSRVRRREEWSRDGPRWTGKSHDCLLARRKARPMPPECQYLTHSAGRVWMAERIGAAKCQLDAASGVGRRVRGTRGLGEQKTVGPACGGRRACAAPAPPRRSIRRTASGSSPGERPACRPGPRGLRRAGSAAGGRASSARGRGLKPRPDVLGSRTTMSTSSRVSRKAGRTGPSWATYPSNRLASASAAMRDSTRSTQPTSQVDERHRRVMCGEQVGGGLRPARRSPARCRAARCRGRRRRERAPGLEAPVRRRALGFAELAELAPPAAYGRSASRFMMRRSTVSSMSTSVSTN